MEGFSFVSMTDAYQVVKDLVDGNKVAVISKSGCPFCPKACNALTKVHCVGAIPGGKPFLVERISGKNAYVSLF